MNSHCNECGGALRFASDLQVRESARMGVYYEGPPICDECGRNKYEDACFLYENLDEGEQ